MKTSTAKATGCITVCSSRKRYYEVTATDGEVYRMNIPENEVSRFQLGDVIDFEVEVHEKGKKAVAPVKRYNKYFSELEEAFKSDQTITGHIYGKNSGGFLVSCNNYKCFLPFSQIQHQDVRMQETEKLLHTQHVLKIISIKGECLVVSQIEALKAEATRLRQEELNELYEGFEFTGKVKCVTEFGVFITYKHMDVLLHMSNIAASYKADAAKEEKDTLRLLMKAVFAKGRAVHVKVDKIAGRNVWAGWNTATEPNASIYDELQQQGFPVKPREEESPYMLWLKSRDNEATDIISTKKAKAHNHLYMPTHQSQIPFLRRLVSLFF